MPRNIRRRRSRRRTPRQWLSELAALKTDFGPEASVRKRALLAEAARTTLSSADDVLRLHEILCFWRAYPDDRELLVLVEGLLADFEQRRDLKRHRDELADTGVAGTAIHYPFFMQMAQWVATRWPDRLHVDWSEVEEPDKLEKVLSLLALYSETPALDEYAFAVPQWLERLKGPDETDGTFLARRIADLGLDTFMHEYFYEHLHLPMRIAPGAGGPSRTRARLAGFPFVPQRGPLEATRPDLPAALGRQPRRVAAVSRQRGQAIIDLAREAMVTRSRDLDCFAFGDPRDVRLIDCGDGLVFAAIGLLPERRLLFESVYGFLTFKNGVPIGYVLNSALMGSVEVAYNVFETYRGGEAARVYGWLLASLRHLFRADTFTIYPYQLGGEGNDEGLQSGAWWFYQKLGFRARDPQVLALMERELTRMRRDPRHRSSIATLEKLAAQNVYYHLGPERDDVIGVLSLAGVGLRISAYLAQRFGSDRRRGAAVCAREAAAALGVRQGSRFTAGERLAWTRWAPLVLILPGLARWSDADRAALVEVIRAKGGRRESDFVARFDRHTRLRAAVCRLAVEE